MTHSSSINRFLRPYGFCTFNETVKSALKNGTDLQDAIYGAHSTKGIRWIQNISILLGALPFIGVIVGITRIIFSSKQIENLKRIGRNSPECRGLCKKDSVFWASLLTRAVIETLSLGSFLLIGDVFMTIFRSMQPISLPRTHFDTIA